MQMYKRTWNSENIVIDILASVIDRGNIRQERESYLVQNGLITNTYLYTLDLVKERLQKELRANSGKLSKSNPATE